MKLKCLKPLHYHSKLCNNLLLNPRGAFLTSKSEKTQKMIKIFKQFEKISTVFIFGVAIDIALKVAVKSNYVLLRTCINFYKPQFQTGLTKNPKNMTKNAKNFTILGSKTPKNNLLTLNYGLPSSFTTLST